MIKALSMRLLIAALLFQVAFLPGCGPSKSIANVSLDTFSSVANRILPGENTSLKKRVLLLDFINQPEIGEDKISQMRDDFLQVLKEDESLLISIPKRPIPTTIPKDSSQYGMIVDPGIVEKAKGMNMDILIMPTLNPIDVSIKKRGIWPFRKLKREVEIFISITVLDVTNGTLYLTNMEKRKIKLKDKVWEEDVDNWKLDEDIVVLDSISLLEDHASAIHKVLKGKPWSGRIISTNGNEITINAGNEIGIRKGLSFEVFAKGEPITALNGIEYYTRGPMVGQIEISSAEKDYSIGVSSSENQFEIGQTVRLMK